MMFAPWFTSCVMTWLVWGPSGTFSLNIVWTRPPKELSIARRPTSWACVQPASLAAPT